VEGGQAARDAGQGWFARNKWYCAAAVLFCYVLVARVIGERKS